MDDSDSRSLLLHNDNARKALLESLRIVLGDSEIALPPKNDDMTLNRAGFSAITISVAMNRVERQFGITVGCALPETTIGEILRRIERAADNSPSPNST